MTGEALDSGDGMSAERLREGLRANERRLLRIGGPAAVGLAVTASLLALSGIGLVLAKLAGVAAFFGHGLALRTGIVLPAYREIDSHSRGLLFRWLCRLAYLAAGFWGYATFPVPGVNLVVVPATFVALTMSVGWYARWTGARDERGKPPHVVEKIILLTLVLAVAATVVLLLLVALVTGFAVSWLLNAW